MAYDPNFSYSSGCAIVHQQTKNNNNTDMEANSEVKRSVRLSTLVWFGCEQSQSQESTIPLVEKRG